MNLNEELEVRMIVVKIILVSRFFIINQESITIGLIQVINSFFSLQSYMSFVKQIALTLNLIIPLYFFFYQLQLFNQTQINNNLQSVLYNILHASIVLLSPIFHILALLHPSYCYKGHCPPPHHYKKHTLQQKTYQQHKKQIPQIKQNLTYSQNVKFNDDLIQESIASSKDDIPNYQKQLKIQNQYIKQTLPTNKRQFLNIEEKQDEMRKQGHFSDRKRDKSFLKLQKIETPPTLGNFQVSYQQPKIEQSSNVNEFSNIPFFNRSSRRSLSNMGDGQSPRFSRRSIVQATQQSIVEPLITVTPKRQRKQSRQERLQVDYSNVKQVSARQAPSHRQSISDVMMTELECEICDQCQIPKYLRMKHCYRCSRCVHKYDHHCVLLNICIGERNQKYYIAFLYAHFYNTCIVLNQLLTGIKYDVRIDPKTGIESLDALYTFKAISIILLLLNFILTTYLILIHTKFFFNGSTTYQKERRQTINYFKHIKKHYHSYDQIQNLTKNQLQNYHPFNQGPFKNAFKVIAAGKLSYDWKLPFTSTITMIEMKDKKQMTNFNQINHDKNRPQKYQWGEESQSSNNIVGKTTKSRQSGVRKSKQQDGRSIVKNLFK